MSLGSAPPDPPEAKEARCRECGIRTERAICPGCGTATGLDEAPEERFVPNFAMSGLREVELPEGPPIELAAEPARKPR